MQNKNFKDKLTIKNINKTMGAAAFVLVFIFTFLFCSELKVYWIILLSTFGALLLALIAAWIVLILYVRNRDYKNDTNKQKIDQALDALKEEAKKEREEHTNA